MQGYSSFTAKAVVVRFLCICFIHTSPLCGEGECSWLHGICRAADFTQRDGVNLFLFGIQGVCGQIEVVIAVMDDGFQVVGSALDVHRNAAALETKIAPEAFGNFRGFHVTVIDEEIERFRLFRVITLALVAAAGIADDVFFFDGSFGVIFRAEVMGGREVKHVIRRIQPGLVALQGAGLVFGQVERSVAFGSGGAAVSVVLAGGVVLEDVVGFFQLVERVMHASDGEKEEFGDAIEVFALERGFEQYPGIAFAGDFLKECRGSVNFLQQFVADGFVFVFDEFGGLGVARNGQGNGCGEQKGGQSVFHAGSPCLGVLIMQER